MQRRDVSFVTSGCRSRHSVGGARLRRVTDNDRPRCRTTSIRDIMFRRSYHVATSRRGLALACSALLSACALHGPGHPVVSTLPETAAPPATVREGYVVDTPEFALVTSSSPAKATALESLRGSVAAFQWLFDNPAPHIGVVVVDGRTMSPPAAAAMMPEDLTTIMVMTGDPDPVEPAKSFAELASAVRTMSADAWLHDYADQWASAVDAEGVNGGVEPDARSSRAETLPHWLRVGALRVIAEGKGPAVSSAIPPTTLPLRDLFTYELRPEEISLVGRMLHHPEQLRDDSVGASSDEGIARSFILQSASVLRFLRETEGGAATSDLFGASMIGMSTEDILAQLPHPTTVAALESSWLHWASDHQRDTSEKGAP